MDCRELIHTDVYGLALTLTVLGAAIEVAGLTLVARDIGALKRIKAAIESRPVVIRPGAITSEATLGRPTIPMTPPPPLPQRVTNLEDAVHRLGVELDETTTSLRKKAREELEDLGGLIQDVIREREQEMLRYFTDLTADLTVRRLGVVLIGVGISLTLAGGLLGAAS